jgi:TolB-like protein/DNA-binding winged helix-turn-helix (wHTH) protein/Tfp pilus assembly protein PilF
MVVSAQPRPVSFGEFVADFRLKELRRNGIRLKLPRQPLVVLEMLLERPREVVTREELRARLWPEETFVDFDHSLNVAINRLRATLCDSAEEPHFIETVPRVGYRFIATVNSRAPAASSEPTPAAAGTEIAHKTEPAPQEELRPSLNSQMRWYAVVLALVLAGSLTFYFAPHTRRQPSPPPAEKIMLAVLPFENLTGDANNEYFSDGLTEEMITQLAQLQPDRLGVIARTSVMAYKHGDRSVARVGSQLGVQYILEGSLRQSAGRVRVTAQLIQANDQTHLWARDYDRDLGDILTLEQEVSSDVAREIQLELTGQQQASLTRPRPVDPDAHELYLKGRFYWNKRTPEGIKKSVEYFQGAIRKDPNYAEAYVGLADAYRFLMNNLSPEEVMPKARAAAEKALVINPNLAEAHASLGLIVPYFDWDWEAAKKHFQRAIELNPNYATAHHWYAEAYLTIMGRMDESLAEMRAAQRLDPFSCAIEADLGKTLYFARRYDEAAAQLRKALDLDPNCYPALIWLRPLYVDTGRYSQAFEVFDKEQALTSPDVRLEIQADIYAQMGRTEEARRLLAQLLKLAQKEHVDPGSIAAVYIHLGDKAQAFAWLEKAYAERSNYMSSLKVWGLYDPIRSDPRFVDLERRVKLVP